MTPRTAIRHFTTQLAADGRSPLTVSVYRRELERLFTVLGHSVPIERVRPATLARYLVSPEVGHRSPRTLNRAKTVFRLFFAYLTETGAIRENPARLLQHARLDPPLPVALTASEVRRFLKALREDRSKAGRRDQALFTLLLASGLRLSAALALTVEDLDLRAATATTVGKHGRTQRVFLNEEIVRLLRSHLKRAAISSGPIFRGRSGPLTTRQAQYRFHVIAERAGITRRVTVHSLRHTFATRLRRKTGDLRIVQLALGHRQLSTTEVYAAVGEEEVRRAVAG